MKLKKNAISVNMINIGEQTEAQITKLEKFISSVNNNDNSHFANVKPNLGQLIDSLVGSPVLGNANVNNILNDDLNLNPQDPELAQILQISLEEYK